MELFRNEILRKGRKSSKSQTGGSNHGTNEAYSAAQTATSRNNPPQNTKTRSRNRRSSQHPTRRSGNDLSSQYTTPGSGGSSLKNARTGSGNEPPSQHPGARSGNEPLSRHPGARSGNNTASQYTDLSSQSGLSPSIHELPGNDLDLHTSISELDSSLVVTESARSLPSPVETSTNSALKDKLPLQRPPPDVSTAECPYGILRPVLTSKT